MSARNLLAGGLLLAFAGQAFPQAGLPEFYIVKNPDGKCVVVDKKLARPNTVVVGNQVYYSRADAEKALRTVCTD